ncbi:MAG TPA: DUF4468 domain-containing protein [Sphingobacteriaceae bacterium]
MKRQLLLMLLLLPCITWAQDKFELTFNGFRNAADTTKDYVVIDIPNLDKATLYKNAMIYLSKQYVSPKDVLSTVDNESITINAVSQNAVKIKHLYLNPSWDVNYTITLQFRDNKVRVSEPSLNKISTRTGDIFRTVSINPYTGNGMNNKEIYNKKADLKLEDAKKNLEAFVNTYIENLNKGITSTNNQEEW